MTRFLTFGATLLLSTAAYAGGSHEHGQPQPQGYNATANNTALAGAAALSRSAAASHSAASAGATGGAATARGGAGGSGTGQAYNGGNTMNYSGGSYNGPRYIAPDVSAPSISTANECALPRSFGLSALLGGASGGWARESENCKRQRMAKYLDRIGDHKTAREVMCLEDDMRRAAYSSGHPCARDVRGWAGD